MTITDLWAVYRRELARLLNESTNPHLSNAEAEQEALRVALTAAGVGLPS